MPIQDKSTHSAAKFGVAAPTPAHRQVLAQLVRECEPTAGLMHDAHLAALALSHGLTLCSADRDFARFPRLNWRNPLV